MLSVKDLQLGYSDALNYTQRQNKICLMKYL